MTDDQLLFFRLFIFSVLFVRGAITNPARAEANAPRIYFASINKTWFLRSICKSQPVAELPKLGLCFVTHLAPERLGSRKYLSRGLTTNLSSLVINIHFINSLICLFARISI